MDWDFLEIEKKNFLKLLIDEFFFKIKRDGVFHVFDRVFLIFELAGLLGSKRTKLLFSKFRIFQRTFSEFWLGDRISFSTINKIFSLENLFALQTFNIKESLPSENNELNLMILIQTFLSRFEKI